MEFFYSSGPSCSPWLPAYFPIYLIGFLDPGADSENLASGTKMELPLWLAKAISGRRAMSVSTELPKQYREGYREILSAEASVVDLHKLGPFYYGFGSQLLQFDHPDSPDIAKMLLQVHVLVFRYQTYTLFIR